MGLFSKKGTASEPKAPDNVQNQKWNTREEEETVWVNLSDKMLRIEMVDEYARLKDVVISDEGDRIRLAHQGILIAEVTKRGKAYKELEPYVGKMAVSMTVSAKEGDYGPYYRMRLEFKNTVTTVSFTV